MIFAKKSCSHGEVEDYGTSEAGETYDGDQATKRLEKDFVKLTKCLKDMLDNICPKPMIIRNYRLSASFILDYSPMLYEQIAQQSISPGSKSQEPTIYQTTDQNLELLCCLLSLLLGSSKISLKIRTILFKKAIYTTTTVTSKTQNGLLNTGKSQWKKMRQRLHHPKKRF